MKIKIIPFESFLKIGVWTLFFLVFGAVEAQNSDYKILRATTGTGGSSQVVNTNKGRYIIHQSIGQSSVIGTSQNKGFYLRQGFQQPIQTIKVVKESKLASFVASVYPNPFEKTVSVAFQEKTSTDVYISVYDVTGKRLFQNVFSPTSLVNLELSAIPSGTYFLNISSNKNQFTTKLIKI